MSYAVYGSGETQFEVPIKDYGIELRYRRQIAREWLFIELLGRMLGESLSHRFAEAASG